MADLFFFLMWPYPVGSETYDSNVWRCRTPMFQSVHYTVTTT